MKRSAFITLMVILLIPLLVWAGAPNKKEKTETFTITTSEQAGPSSSVDTFTLFGMYQEGYDAFWGKMVLHASPYTDNGLGLVDTGWIWLYAVAAGDWFLLDSFVQEGLPMTFNTAFVGNDTLFKEQIKAVVMVSDSTGDTVLSADYRFDHYFMRTGEKHR